MRELHWLEFDVRKAVDAHNLAKVRYQRALASVYRPPSMSDSQFEDFARDNPAVRAASREVLRAYAAVTAARDAIKAFHNANHKREALPLVGSDSTSVLLSRRGGGMVQASRVTVGVI